MFQSKMIRRFCSMKRRISLAYIENNLSRNSNLIFLHCLLGNSSNFTELIKDKRISNHTNTYLLDCRNHGSSPHTPTHSIQDLSTDLFNFIIDNNLLHPTNLTLIGHSMGGLALMKFTQMYPFLQSDINRIIILDTHCSSNHISSKLTKTKKLLQELLMINLNQPTQYIYRQIDKKVKDKISSSIIKKNIKIQKQNQHNWIINLPVLTKEFYHILNFQLQSNQWRAPVDVIYGSKSSLVSEQQIQLYCHLYPQMKKTQNFHKIQDSGHWIHIQHPNQFLTITQHLITPIHL